LNEILGYGICHYAFKRIGEKNDCPNFDEFITTSCIKNNSILVYFGSSFNNLIDTNNIYFLISIRFRILVNDCQTISFYGGPNVRDNIFDWICHRLICITWLYNNEVEQKNFPKKRSWFKYQRP
jgi:hypothetical protein